MSRSVSIRRTSRTVSKNLKQRSGLLAAAIAGVVLGGSLLAPARAGTFTWDVSRTTTWSDPTAWGGVAPTGANNTDNLIFGGSEGVLYTSTVDTPDPFIINRLTLNSSATTTTEIINNSNVNGFSLAGTTPSITQNGAGTFQIDSAIALTGATTLNGTGTGTTIFNGVIGGVGPLTVNGGGIWRITNLNNTYTGNTTITNGVLEINSNNTDFPLLTTGNSPLGVGTTVNINAATPGGLAELRIVSGSGRALLFPTTTPASVNKTFAFGLNGGTINIDGRISDNTSLFNITTPNVTGGSTVLFKFNGGPNHLSSNGLTDGNWSNANNALRLGVTNNANFNSPIRVELSSGATFVMPNIGTLNNILTVRGVPGGDPTSGPD